jgi:hypothetical protein
MTTTPARPRHPLEGDWVELPLAIEVAGRTVTGTARANWGAVHVGVTSPVAGLSRGWDGRGCAFAMACHHRPEYRYALGGQFTARGVEAAGRMLADLFLDWLAVSRHEAEVDETCRRTRQELADLERRFAARRQPLHEKRSALRRRFKAGGLTQREYQWQLKDVGRGLEQVGRERWDAEQEARGRFASSVQDRCGRKVSLDEAERLLTEVALVVEGRPGEAP